MPKHARQAVPTEARTPAAKPNPQPLHAAQIAEALLKMKTSSSVSGMSIPTLYRAAKDGRLKLIKVGTRCTRIRAADLQAYLASLG